MQGVVLRMGEGVLYIHVFRVEEFLCEFERELK